MEDSDARTVSERARRPLGLAATVIAGGWMAVDVACNVDPDCDEEEQCREIPAPPGGVPYRQCMAR